jgi:translation initiation factor 1
MPFDILNFDDADANTNLEQPNDESSIIHLRIQQRMGRKTLTTVQGIPEDIDKKLILKAFKKEFACNGTVIHDPELGQVIQLQGDHRTKIAEFLLKSSIATKERIKIHGF